MVISNADTCPPCRPAASPNAEVRTTRSQPSGGRSAGSAGTSNGTLYALATGRVGSAASVAISAYSAHVVSAWSKYSGATGSWYMNSCQPPGNWLASGMRSGRAANVAKSRRMRSR
jgi:hypothetical protein